MAFVRLRERERKRKEEKYQHRDLCQDWTHTKHHDTLVLHGHALLSVWHNDMFHCSWKKKINEWANTFLLVSVCPCQKSRFQVQHHAFLQAFPPEKRGGNKPWVRITYRNKIIIKIPQRNVNNNASGRSEGLQWIGIPFKNIWTAAQISVRNPCLSRSVCTLPFYPITVPLL